MILVSFHILRNNKNINDIEILRSEIENIKGFILQQSQQTLILSNTMSNKTRFTNDTDEGTTSASLNGLQPDTDPDIDNDPNTENEHENENEHEPDMMRILNKKG